MAKEDRIGQAEDAFVVLCQALDQMQWAYKKNEDALYVQYQAPDSPFQSEFVLLTEATGSVAILVSQLPFVVPKLYRQEVALGINLLNASLHCGAFAFGLKESQIYYRASNGFLDCELGTGLFEQMIRGAAQVVDDYTAELRALALGEMSLEAFIATFSL